MTDKTQPTAHAEITAPISADLRRIDDAGAQSAPAKQSEALRLAELLEKTAITFGESKRGSKAEAAAELRRQDAENQQLRGSLEAQRMITDQAIALGKESDAKLSATQVEAKHWRTNHDNVVARLRIFTQRPDIPKELADRLPWYRELVRLQAVEAQALQQSAEITDAAIDRIAESMPGGLDGFLKAWGWRQFARAILQAAPPAPAAVAVPDERAAFEAWAKESGYQRDELARSKLGLVSPEYFNPNTESTWQAWQARASLAAAPAQEHATQLAGGAVAYLDLGAGGYLDIGTDLSDEQLSKLPKGRHMLVIGGTYGVDGYAAAPGEMQKESDAAQLLKKYRKLCLEIGRGDSYHIARIDAAIAAAPAQAQEDARDADGDKALLDFLRDTSCDLRSIDVPTGGDDSDVHWRVIEHHMSEPREREIGRSWTDDPREAIRAARAAQGGAA